jgi:PAS domain S-box-containing protein
VTRPNGIGLLVPQDLDIGFLLESVRHAVIVVEASTGRIVLWNPAASEVFGYSSAEALGMNAEELVPERLKVRCRAEMYRYCQTGYAPYIDSGKVLDLPAVRKGEEEIHIELTLSPIDPIRDVAAHDQFVLGIVRDVTERKRTEMELREVEGRYRALVEQIPAVTYTQEPGDPKFAQPSLTMYASPQIEEQTGYPPQAFVEDPKLWVKLLHPDDRERVLAEDARTEKSGEPFRMEFRLIASDGRVVWVRDEAVLVRNEEGHPKYWQGVQLDITEGKEAEEALHESNRQIENILESITDAFFALDRQWRFTYVNERARSLIQRAEGEELLGKNIWELYPELVGTTADHKYHEALREHKTMEFEAEHPLTGMWYEVHAYPSEEGLSVYFRNITERKRDEEELRESEERFRATFEQAAVGIAHTAPDGSWLRVNQRLCDIVGYTREELLQKTFQDITHPDDLDADLEQVRRLLTSEISTYSMEKRYIRKDGSVVWIGLTVSLVREPSGEPGYFIAVVEEITGRKRAEEELETRTHQQAAVTALGLRALANTDLQQLMDDVVALVAQILEVEYTKIVELLPGGKELLLLAGVGFEEGLVGRVTESAGLGSQAGFTLLSEEPVIVEDLATETRFRSPPLLHEHGAVSGMSVVIHGREGPFGVLGANTTSPRTFSEDDANFLQAVANVLAAAVERKDTEEKLEEVREAERSRMARDLHDEALQDLAHAIAEAQLARSTPQEPELAQREPELTWRLERLSSALQRAEQQVRGAVYDLRLEGERDRPFSELLKTLVNLHRRMAPDLNISLNLWDGVFEGPLDKTGREILRILGEALTNARRHSGAQNVRVAVWTTSEEKVLWAEVSDDGRGFNPALRSPTTGGMGIRGMRERARALGGVLQIVSEPGEGTRIHFKLALKKVREEPEEEVRVLLVEDHASFREALTIVFERKAGFNVVGQAASLSEARRMLEGVDVAVVDLGLPDGYGGDLINELRETSPRAQALVLSAILSRAEIARAVESGAAGVLHKSVGVDEVVEAVQRLRAGEPLLPLEEIVELLRFAGSRRDQMYEARQAVALLTSREKEVLQALAEGLDSQEIAERLHISIKTERNHMSSILTKLRVHSRLQALVVALRLGVAKIG